MGQGLRGLGGPLCGMVGMQGPESAEMPVGASPCVMLLLDVPLPPAQLQVHAARLTLGWGWWVCGGRHGQPLAFGLATASLMMIQYLLVHSLTSDEPPV